MADPNLPIDIHTNKLLDWLISRRHCKKDYQKSLNIIRSKVKLAIQDMPQIDEVKELLQKNVFDYYVCQRIVEILKSTDKDSKNIFGQYTSKRLLDWQEIVKLYQYDNVFLAEDAQILIRNVNYEVPSLKKLSAKYEQQISDLERAIEQCKKQSKNYEHEYQANAKKLDIPGLNVKQELATQLEILPKKMDELFGQIQTLIPVCDYYKTFVQFISQSGVECLPMLHYLLAKGNTTYFEYRTGNPPEVIQDFKLGAIVDLEENKENLVEDDDDNAIDFGDQIDFGDDNASTDTPSTGNGDFVKVDPDELGSEGEAISWDIESHEEVKEDVSEKIEEKVARGDDAHSVLLRTELRNRFANELIEVESFLCERIYELESNHMLASYLFQTAPSVIQLTTIDGVRAMLSQVTAIRQAYESPALKVLYYMKDSPKYIDNICKKLNHLKLQSEKALAKANDLETRRSNLLTELSTTGPHITRCVQHTKALQQRIEDCISKKYNNRPVNIMGGVQVI